MSSLEWSKGGGEGILGRCLYQSGSSQEIKTTPKFNPKNYQSGTKLLTREPKRQKKNTKLLGK